MHDFKDPELGKVNAYGVYGIAPPNRYHVSDPDARATSTTKLTLPDPVRTSPRGLNTESGNSVILQKLYVRYKHRHLVGKYHIVPRGIVRTSSY